MILRDFIAFPEVTVADLKDDVRDGLAVKRLSIRHDIPPEGGQVPPARAVSFFLDPAMHYACRDYVLRIGNHDKGGDTTITYGPPSDGFPVVEKMETWTADIATGKRLELRESRVASKVEFGPVPDSEFTLAAFGLNDPRGADDWRVGWPTWLLGGVAVCVAASFLFRRLGLRA